MSPGRIAIFQCGESNLWPQFPVTLKIRVVEINVFNAYKILECVTINRKDLSYSVRAPENLSTYHMIRNSIVKSLSNMKNKSNDFLSCKTTRHAVKTFLTETYMCLLNWLLRANVTEGNYKCHLAIGLFAKYSVVFTTRRKDIRGCGRRGHLNCFSGGSACNGRLRRTIVKNVLIKCIKSLNWPSVVSTVKCCSLSFHSLFFVSGVSLHVQLLLFSLFSAFNLPY